MKQRVIAVLGAGAWGTALAKMLADKGHDVRLWFYDKKALRLTSASGYNPYLPTVKLSRALMVTDDLPAALNGAEAVLLATPVQCVKLLLRRCVKIWPKGAMVVNCSKGIELNSAMLVSEIVKKILPRAPYVVLSGPSFADEVGHERETAVVVAATQSKFAKQAQEIFGNEYFRPYVSNDVVGVEIAGAYKNVLAIASGLIAGLGKGENLQAALIARGLNEMAEFGQALGGKRETFLGLAGVGDLTLTATSKQSRNYSFGLALGSGRKASLLLKADQPVVEGFFTVKSVLKRAKKLNLELTIAHELNEIINHRIKPRQAVAKLMRRTWKAE